MFNFLKNISKDLRSLTRSEASEEPKITVSKKTDNTPNQKW